jgi:glutaredoxin
MVTLYTRSGCHLCEQAEQMLAKARSLAEFELEIIDIDSDTRLRELYNEEVPVVAIDGKKVFQYAVDLDSFVRRVRG